VTGRGAARAALVGLAGLAGAAAIAAPAERYLVIGAIDPTPAGIVRQAQPLAAAALAAGEGPGLIVANGDCVPPRTGYAWTAVVADSREVAAAALERLEPRIAAARIERCVPRPHSLLALGIPAVDASIADVPADAVNWTDADRVSTILPIRGDAGGVVLALQRRYVADPEDPREGRRTRVLRVPPGQAPRTLLDDCGGPAWAAASRAWLALACESEQAADQPLHTVHVFSADGTPVATVARCRDPRLTGNATLQCRAESVDAEGRLHLAPRTVRLVPR
jgi:hypothetical protein